MPGWVHTRRLFLALLGVVHLIAFLSLWSQVHGLVGSSGILPVREMLAAALEQLGQQAYRVLPTLCWLNGSDGGLTALCAAGVIASLLLIAGVAPAPMLLVLWAAYLSLCVAGQTFLNFQWDALLLETTVLALFVAPWSPWPRGVHGRPPPAPGVWLLRWLLFKLMFLSGVTKLLSGDDTWRDLAALDVHYQTQPLPTPFSWHAHQMPHAVHEASTIVMFAIELGLPFLIFCPRRARAVAAAGFALLMVLISATGNYGFFNLLTLVLCVSLLDDRMLRALLPGRWRRGARARTGPAAPDARPRAIWRQAVLTPLAAAMFALSALTFVRELVRTPRDAAALPGAVRAPLRALDTVLLSWSEPTILTWIGPLRSVNGYGLFRVMTTERPEISIEVSGDGAAWQPWELRWKPGDLQRRPRFVQPHMPRLDWSLWFAALHPRGHQYWLERLLARLLEGGPDVLDLLEPCPLGEAGHVEFVRLVLYRYEFTDRAARSASGDWWRRQLVGNLTPPIPRASLTAPTRPPPR